jgi:hypothetical protein
MASDGKEKVLLPQLFSQTGFSGRTLLPTSTTKQKDRSHILRRSGQCLIRIDPVEMAHSPKGSKTSTAAPFTPVQKRRSMGLHV